MTIEVCSNSNVVRAVVTAGIGQGQQHHAHKSTDFKPPAIQHTPLHQQSSTLHHSNTSDLHNRLALTLSSEGLSQRADKQELP
jgi:hypothetical protein